MPARPLETTPAYATVLARWGQLIAEARRARELTQVQLAGQIGVAVATLRTWEGGSRAPALARRRKLAEVLGIPPAELAADADHCRCCGRLW